jgi:DNA-binding response OmpR family regulator
MKVIVAEDDIMLADFLADALADLGHEVSGVAFDIAGAVALARTHHPGLAILDMQLGRGELGTEIANRLSASNDLDGIGILYVTGEAERVVRVAKFGHACLHKPYSIATLQLAMTIVDGMVHGIVPPRTLPPGMMLLGLHPAATIGATIGGSALSGTVPC